MANTAEEITVALTGSISIAPYSGALTLPTDPASALDVAFVDLGYTTEDGVTFTATPSVEEIMAWQKATAVRRIVTNRESSIAFTLEQLNLDNWSLAFGGGTWVTTAESPGPPVVPAYHRYDPPADADPLAEYACVVDFVDGAKRGRLVMIRGNVTESVETQFVRSEAAMLPIQVDGLTPDDADSAWYFLSNDAAFAAA